MGVVYSLDNDCQTVGSMLSFHPFHGENICLMDCEMVACRSKSFAHAISFSKYPLKPMEIFLIEIEKCERGWSGNLRIGLTQHDPNKKFHLPQFSIPDLQQLGKSWIFTLPSHNSSRDIGSDDGNRRNSYRSCDDSILGDGEYVYLYRGFLKKSLLRPSPWYWNVYDENDDDEAMNLRDSTCCEILPTDVGSRIGLIYLVKNNKAEMHFIINGQDQGPCAMDIPYLDSPLYVVVDVYGTTKQVRIIPVGGGKLT